MSPPLETKTATGSITPDYTYHELAKFLKLAMKGNPAVLELLYLDTYLELTWVGQVLVRNRDALLSQRIRKTYGGFIGQQIGRIRTGGEIDEDRYSRRSKQARHITRLAIQCKEALETGTLRVKLAPFEVALCHCMGNLVLEDQAEFLDCAKLMLDDIDACETELPEAPDFEFWDELLFMIRKASK